jgi:hypothetical protein
MDIAWGLDDTIFFTIAGFDEGFPPPIPPFFGRADPRTGDVAILVSDLGGHLTVFVPAPRPLMLILMGMGWVVAAAAWAARSGRSVRTR